MPNRHPTSSDSHALNSLVTPTELTAALPHAPEVALDRRQRPIPWWNQWLDYLDTARGHGGFRVH